MKVGDLVQFSSAFHNVAKKKHGCLPYVGDDWGCGLVQELYSDGHVTVLWPDRGFELVDDRFLEVVSESR